MVHGDFQQDQRLADGDQLTGIIDWETARIDYPFWDFGLGRWAPGCGAHMPMRGGWTSAPARWKPLSTMSGKAGSVGHRSRGLSCGCTPCPAPGHRAVARRGEPP